MTTTTTPQDVLDRIEDDRFNAKYLLQSTQTDVDIHFLLDHIRTLTAERDRYRDALTELIAALSEVTDYMDEMVHHTRLFHAHEAACKTLQGADDE